MIYYCYRCETHFNDDDIMEIQPDGGTFHSVCRSDDFEELTEKEIIEQLNLGDK